MEETKRRISLSSQRVFWATLLKLSSIPVRITDIHRDASRCFSFCAVFHRSWPGQTYRVLSAGSEPHDVRAWTSLVCVRAHASVSSVLRVYRWPRVSVRSRKAGFIGDVTRFLFLFRPLPTYAVRSSLYTILFEISVPNACVKFVSTSVYVCLIFFSFSFFVFIYASAKFLFSFWFQVIKRKMYVYIFLFCESVRTICSNWLFSRVGVLVRERTREKEKYGGRRRETKRRGQSARERGRERLRKSFVRTNSVQSHWATDLRGTAVFVRLSCSCRPKRSEFTRMRSCAPRPPNPLTHYPRFPSLSFRFFLFVPFSFLSSSFSLFFSFLPSTLSSFLSFSFGKFYYSNNIYI